MARTKISEFSATAADNTDIDSIDIAEGCAPSGINNAIRELMAQLKDFQTGAAGDSFNGPFNGTNVTYSGTLTGGTGVINIGSGQVYKDASGNVGIGTASPAHKLQVNGNIKADGAFFLGSRGTSGYAILTTAENLLSGGAVLTRDIDSTFNPFGIEFYTSATERMRIDSSGNVGIGTSSPQNRLTIQDTNAGAAVPGVRVRNGDATNFHRIDIGYNSGTATGYVPANAVYIDGFKGGGFGNLGGLAIGTSTDAPLVFGTNAAERARIDSSGNLLVGTTVAFNTSGVTIGQGQIKTNTSVTSYANHIIFSNPNGDRGAIYTDGMNTVYANFSDYRLKENVAPMTGALATVAALKPCTYTWKTDGSAGQGFIAHELQAVVPDCVTGEKDAMRTEKYEISPAIPATYDEEGNELTPAIPAVMGEREVPQYQGVDTSFLVATLVAAIQELKAEVDALKAVA